MGCANSVPSSKSINDKSREIENTTCNNYPITQYQNNKSIIYNSYGYKLFPRNNL